MKKQWISVKCGLSRDAKHRQAIGESIWLFLHILDRADWESGRVLEWKDESEAEEMDMPIRTLRDHRRKLEELGYITCVKKQYSQEVIIHNWTNPREYSGKTTNKKQGYVETSPQSDTQSDTQSSTKHVTPTLYSKNQISSAGKFSNPDWDILHGKTPTLTEEDNARIGLEDKYKDIAARLETGLRRGQFPQTTTAQVVYKWIAKKEEEGQSLDRFIQWVMRDERSAEFSWIYHKDPSCIKRDWPQAFPSTLINGERPSSFYA